MLADNGSSKGIVDRLDVTTLYQESETFSNLPRLNESIYIRLTFH